MKRVREELSPPIVKAVDKPKAVSARIERGENGAHARWIVDVINTYILIREKHVYHRVKGWTQNPSS